MCINKLMKPPSGAEQRESTSGDGEGMSLVKTELLSGVFSLLMFRENMKLWSGVKVEAASKESEGGLASDAGAV